MVMSRKSDVNRLFEYNICILHALNVHLGMLLRRIETNWMFPELPLLSQTSPQHTTVMRWTWLRVPLL